MIYISQVEEVRLDKFLAEKLSITRSQIKLQIDQGNILVNGKVVKAGHLLSIGDEISVNLIEREVNLEPINMNLKVLFEDQYLAVISKDIGVVVHPGNGVDGPTLVNGLKYQFSNVSEVDPLRPGIVHRLDKDTSGLLVIAKTDKAHEKLVDLFKSRQVHKEYICYVHGKLLEEGIIDLPIGRSLKNRTMMAVVEENSKEAITKYYPIKNYNEYTYLRVVIETGRTHQIRVHMAYINHPVVGDLVYGRKNSLGIKTQLLHAYRVNFIHPFTNEIVDVVDEVPMNFIKFRRYLDNGEH